MAQLSKTVQYTMTNADATVTGLAASATVARFIRSIHVANATASPVTWNFGVGATLTGVAGADAFGKALAANATDLIYFGGKGKRVDNTNIRAFASANTAVNLTVIYDEIDLQ